MKLSQYELLPSVKRLASLAFSGASRLLPHHNEAASYFLALSIHILTKIYEAQYTTDKTGKQHAANPSAVSDNGSRPSKKRAALDPPQPTARRFLFNRKMIIHAINSVTALFQLSAGNLDHIINVERVSTTPLEKRFALARYEAGNKQSWPALVRAFEGRTRIDMTAEMHPRQQRKLYYGQDLMLTYPSGGETSLFYTAEMILIAGGFSGLKVEHCVNTSVKKCQKQVLKWVNHHDKLVENDFDYVYKTLASALDGVGPGMRKTVLESPCQTKALIGTVLEHPE